MSSALFYLLKPLYYPIQGNRKDRQREAVKMRPVGYLSGAADTQLACLLGLFGAVEIAGAMWRGKTWTVLAFPFDVRAGKTSRMPMVYFE